MFQKLKRHGRRVLGFEDKRLAELKYWQRQHDKAGWFRNDWYRKYMLEMAGAKQADFDGLFVADFGCGPRGSLSWLENATTFGIDLLVPLYADAFPEDIKSHGVIYVASTERHIPLPDNSLDVMFTMNALDHVSNLQVMCDEICRVLKPGGKFAASFNLHERPTVEEPHELTEPMLDAALLHRFNESSRRFGKMHPDDSYAEMFSGTSTFKEGEPGYMWYCGTLND